MKLHILKIKDNYYFEIVHGYKNFELRLNDRDFKPFDLIHFVNTKNEDFLNDSNNIYQITYVLKDVPEYGLKENYCILAIKKFKEQE